ncbi:MAG TPA: hypothetical protein VFG04_15515 [Planctomycetaceae bacterium]|jgi:hypothetical protein|nr:hypothetical protein [Planctomycetaceae bacterium]
MAASTVRPTIVKYLYTHNPFYAISAVLMLYAIRAAYETLGSQASNCWLMTGGLAGYTLILAAIGVWIVRWGKVWEDARSILLLLLVLFLAVSISTDDLFVRAETSSTASLLLLCGFLFSAAVSEGVLWGAGIRLGLRYRVPYHLLLALFYVAPWFYSPGLHPQLEVWLNWLLLLFPCVAAVLFLTLVPAVRRGARYLVSNGTPWPWPWFPGAAFGVIAAAVSLRSYALTMTFGLDGDIWKKLPSGRAIVFDTIWGTYFLVPLGFAILILLLEIGLVTADRRFARRVVNAAGLLLLLAVPWGGDAVFHGFLQTVVRTIGSPLWLALWGLIAFYLFAWLRGVPEAIRPAMVAGALLAVVGRKTIGLETLTAPHPGPILVIAAILLTRGIWFRSSWICTAASVLLSCGLWLLLPQTSLADLRMPICGNVLWVALGLIGLLFHDSLALTLRILVAALFPVATLLAIAGEPAASVPVLARGLYVVLLAIISLLIARVWRNLWFLYGFGGIVGVSAHAGIVSSFHRAAALIGRDAMLAFAWSLGALLLGFLISAQKARWLPRRLWPRWGNGKRVGLPLTTEPASANGSSPDAPS